MRENLKTNDCVNPVGGEDMKNAKADDANSGSTHCSFSAINHKLTNEEKQLIDDCSVNGQIRKVHRLIKSLQERVGVLENQIQLLASNHHC